MLHTLRYGDGGMVAHVLTDVHGRQSFMVQGVRSKRGHGNKAALLQPMFLIDFEGLASHRLEMHRFRELRAAVPLRIPLDVRKSTVALFMAEMLYRLVREVEPNSPLFEFVWSAVEALDGLEDRGAAANFHLWFMVGLSRHLGFFPGNEWSPGRWFDIREGVFTTFIPLHGHFTQGNAELLARFMYPPEGGLSDFLCSLNLNRERRNEFMTSMLSFFGYHLDAVRDIRSVEILREVF